METFEDIEIQFKKEAKAVLNNLQQQFLKFADSSRINPQILENFKINYYETPTPLNQLASINLAGPLQLHIKPYDVSIIKDIEKVLINSKMPFTVVVDSQIIRINFPPMTQERRKETTKQLHATCEQAKVKIRLLRTKSLKEIKNLTTSEDQQKRFQSKLQLKIDNFIQEITYLCAQKEEKILKI